MTGCLVEKCGEVPEFNTFQISTTKLGERHDREGTLPLDVRNIHPTRLRSLLAEALSATAINSTRLTIVFNRIRWCAAHGTVFACPHRRAVPTIRTLRTPATLLLWLLAFLLVLCLSQHVLPLYLAHAALLLCPAHENCAKCEHEQE
jgi:hypothetical protein